MAFLFLVHVQIWWATFDLRDVGEWTFVTFLFVLLIPVLVYFLVFLLVPDFRREETVDLRADLFESRRVFFAVLAMTPVTSLAMDFALNARIYLDEDVVFRAFFILLATIGFSSPNERLHRALAAVSLSAFIGYIGLLFLRLG